MYFKLRPRKGSVDQVVENLDQLKKKNSRSGRLRASLMLCLFMVLFFQWKWGLAWLDEIDQFQNDLKEQAQVIEMERANLQSLKKLESGHQALQENLQMIYTALPSKDEESEAMMGMLEDMATKNRLVIQSMGIRKVSQSQLNYQALHGVVDVYEYGFTLESDLPNILSFLTSLRNSMRLIDVMAMEIEEGQEGYRASFLLHSYHLNST